MNLKSIVSLTVLLTASLSFSYPFYLEIKNDRKYEMFVQGQHNYKIAPGNSLVFYVYGPPPSEMLHYRSTGFPTANVYHRSLKDVIELLNLSSKGRSSSDNNGQNAPQVTVHLIKDHNGRYQPVVEKEESVNDFANPLTRLTSQKCECSLEQLLFLGTPTNGGTQDAPL